MNDIVTFAYFYSMYIIIFSLIIQSLFITNHTQLIIYQRIIRIYLSFILKFYIKNINYSLFYILNDIYGLISKENQKF